MANVSLVKLIEIADTRKNIDSKMDLLAAIAGKAEGSIISIHSEINEAAAKGFVKPSYLFAIGDHMGICKSDIINYFKTL
tara:strand:- start:431 stop:670 length:240 start_codon:yes stop_codon:yes gene_type:complete